MFLLYCSVYYTGCYIDTVHSSITVDNESVWYIFVHENTICAMHEFGKM